MSQTFERETISQAGNVGYLPPLNAIKCRRVKFPLRVSFDKYPSRARSK